MMNWLVGIGGVVLVGAVLWDVFETIVLPRRVSRKLRLAPLFNKLSWQLWSLPARKMRAGNRREYYLSYYGPLSVLLLLVSLTVLLSIRLTPLRLASLATRARRSSR